MGKGKTANPAAATLLVELLTEELPPKSLRRLGESFAEEVNSELIKHRLRNRDPRKHVFSTPRRLAMAIGKVRDGDRIRIVIDRNRLEGSVDLVGEGETVYGPEEGTRVLAKRSPRPDLAPDPQLPADTRLWAALQRIGGGTWGGCVYDVDAIVNKLS